MLIQWALFRGCMWLINVHARNFRGGWQWMQLLLSIASMAGFLFALIFLGRLAMQSQWLDLVAAVTIAVIALPVMTFIAGKTGESIALLSPLALLMAPILAYLLW